MFKTFEKFGYSLNSGGKITLNAVSACDNIGSGLRIQNSGDLLMLGTLGVNSFSRNGDDGILIWSAANINLNKVTVDYNGNLGMWINSAQSLAINTGSFSRNGGEGIDAILTGNLSLNKLQVLGNGDPSTNQDGIHIQQTGIPADAKILNSIIIGHEGYGIYLSGTDTLTLTGTFYYGNDTDGGNSGLDLGWF